MKIPLGGSGVLQCRSRRHQDSDSIFPVAKVKKANYGCENVSVAVVLIFAPDYMGRITVGRDPSETMMIWSTKDCPLPPLHRHMKATILF